MTTLKVGDKAPDFSVTDQNGKVHTLVDYSGKILAIYFYPKDMTPGCTAQACDLRDHETVLMKKNIQVIGVSADDEKRHAKFAEKYELPFPLLADTDLTMIKAYGVWGPKKFMGKEYEGIHRTTFIIDEKGIIKAIIEKVKTKEHAAQILDVL
ncbi:thioredoxin-dependent thiol peroxidase [Wandonia haliotis]|uniref:thioredoxin-dependent peroxiredoxin n=1 Tax=Wandonia haliotis TaxID=574963 RepID=A0ABN1MLX1_9FLAO